MAKDNPIEGVIYDKDGQRVYTTNVDILSLEMNDKLLINSYRNTIYQKALFIEAIRLKDEGVEMQVEGFEYEPELISNSLKSLYLEILNRFGEEYYEQLQKQIFEKDLSFLKYKPENLH